MPLARAAITVTKDTTFEDFSQGVYRLRGIQTGQKFETIITPELNSLITRTLAPINSTVLAPLEKWVGERIGALVPTTTTASTSTTSTTLLLPSTLVPQSSVGHTVFDAKGDVIRDHIIVKKSKLLKFVSFLYANTMSSQTTQFIQLAQQNIANVWRKVAFEELMEQSQVLTSGYLWEFFGSDQTQHDDQSNQKLDDVTLTEVNTATNTGNNDEKKDGDDAKSKDGDDRKENGDKDEKKKTKPNLVGHLIDPEFDNAFTNLDQTRRQSMIMYTKTYRDTIKRLLGQLEQLNQNPSSSNAPL